LLCGSSVCCPDSYGDQYGINAVRHFRLND
jgi:hypothetical protein